MAKTTVYRHSFNIGEKSVAGMARIDQDIMALAAEIQENLMPRVVGAAQFRPGTEYIGTTNGNAEARFIPFIKSVDDTALLEMTSTTLRIWIDDELLTRSAVSSSVVNGDFSSSAGWTLSASSGATASISGGLLTMNADARGSSASCYRAVSTSSANSEHAVAINVTRGPVVFKIGSAAGDDDYLSETELDSGYHSLAFTPAGTYYVHFSTERGVNVIVNSIDVEGAGVVELTAPWSADDLLSIRYDQSNDVIFLANENWRQRKIERRATRSWSLVEYRTEDGPFTLARTAKIRLKPSTTHGNGTLTASDSFFKDEHIGALFRLTHDSLAASWELAGDDSHTDPWRVSGLSAVSASPGDRSYSVQVTGTWSGTLTSERSLDGRYAGFNSYLTYSGSGTTQLSSNLATQTQGGVAVDDNVIAYHRWGFKEGNYTSGNAVVTIRQTGAGGSGVCRVTSLTSARVANIEILSDFKDTRYTSDWLEGEWSDKRGWPSAVAFYDGRLFWARDDKFWGSISDQYYSYTLDEDVNPDASGDAGSIQKSVATGGGIATINWMLPLQRLIFGTTGAETSARSNSFDQPLTPTLCTLKDASTQGCADINPAKIDGRGIFVQRSGVRVYELTYSFEDNDYSSQNLMRLNEDIGDGGITALSVSRQLEPYIWMVRGDGEVPCLLYEPKEKVAGFWRFISDGASGVVEDVVTLPGLTEDRVYFVVRRTISGSTKRYLEKLALRTDAQGGATNLMADSHVTATGPVSSVTAAHLASQTGLVGWGTNGSGQHVPITGRSANGSGVISLGGTYTNVCIGLPYSYRYKSAKLGYGAQGGTPMAQPKRIGEIGLHLADFVPAAVNYGADFDNMYSMPSVEDGAEVSTTATQTVYDQQTFPFATGQWDTDSRVCLSGDAPYPVTYLGLILGMQTNE